MSNVKTDFILEKEHRPCICGLCSKQIGTKTPRITFVVSNEYWVREYKKFYHIRCILSSLKKQLRKLSDDYLQKEVTK